MEGDKPWMGGGGLVGSPPPNTGQHCNIKMVEYFKICAQNILFIAGTCGQNWSRIQIMSVMILKKSNHCLRAATALSKSSQLAEALVEIFPR